jgi:hypothetical protein
MSYTPNEHPRWDSGRGRGPPANKHPRWDSGRGRGPPANKHPRWDSGRGRGPPANKHPRWDSGRGRGPPANDANDNSREGFNRRNERDGDRWNRQGEYRDRNQGDRRYPAGDANIDEPWRQQYQGPPAASNQARTDHASGHYGSRHGQDGVVVAHSAALVDKHTYALTKSAAAHVDTTIFPVQTLEEWKTLPLREKLKSQVSKLDSSSIFPPCDTAHV